MTSLIIWAHGLYGREDRREQNTLWNPHPQLWRTLQQTALYLELLETKDAAQNDLTVGFTQYNTVIVLNGMLSSRPDDRVTANLLVELQHCVSSVVLYFIQ